MPKLQQLMVDAPAPFLVGTDADGIPVFDCITDNRGYTCTIRIGRIGTGMDGDVILIYMDLGANTGIIEKSVADLWIDQ